MSKTRKVFLFFWFLITGIVIIALLQNIFHARSSEKRLQQLEERNKEKQEQVLELQEKYEKSQDPYEKERIIRDELNMQKPGEIIIGLPDQQATRSGDDSLVKTVYTKKIGRIESFFLWIKEKISL